MTGEQANIGEYENSGGIADEPDTVRLKHIARINPTKSELSDLDPETKVSFVPLEDFGINGEIKNTETKRLEDVYDGYTYLREGDIAIAKITPSFENGKGAICRDLENGIGFGTTELHILRPREDVSPEFLWYVLRSKPFLDEAETAMRGVAGQQRVPSEFLKQYQVPQECLNSQQEIVDHLSKKLEKIDDLIGLCGLLVERLHERREAITESAVTQGIRSGRESRPTDILGFDEIPNDWDTTKLGWILNHPPQNGLSPSLTSEDAGIPTFSISAVNRGEINLLDNLKYADITEEEAKQFQIEEGDVLLVRGNGNLNQVGKCGVVSPPIPEKCIYPDILIRLRFKKDIMQEYFVHLLNSPAMRPQIETGARTSTGVWKVSQKVVSDLELPIPPKDEQEEIVDHLNNTVEYTSELVGKISRSQKVFNQKRQALITAAVTGQINVSDA